MSRSETRSASEALAWMKAQKDPNNKILFRGQTQVYPTIKPSITRDDPKTQNDMWTICHDFHRAAMGVTGYLIKNEHDRLSILQHYIRRSPVIDLTGTPEIALYFAILGAEIRQKCVVYSVDRSKAEVPGVVFSDHSFFFALPLEDGGLKHRWIKQDGYSVGPDNWFDSNKVEEFDLLELDGVSCMCFEKGPNDAKLVAELGDLESLDDDPLASKVRGVVTSIAKSRGVYSYGIRKILENSETRDPHGERTAEIDCTIAKAKEVNAPPELIQKLENLKRESEGISWDTSFDVTLSVVQEQLANLSRRRTKEPPVNKEQWTIIGVGVALGLLLVQLAGGLRGDVADLRERMAKVETKIDLVLEGLHIEIKGNKE